MEKEKNTIRHFTDLHAWKEAHLLTLIVYQFTKNFPQEEKFGLAAQMRRAAVSVESNLAEGFGRNTQNDKRQFYTIARGSLLELEAQTRIALNLEYIHEVEYTNALKQIDLVGRLITGLLKSALTRSSY